MIIDDVITCVARKQTPVILTRFKEHEKFLHDAIKEKADHVFLLYGDNSDKENAEIRVKLKQIPENESLILVATGQKIGEGFDFPRLDVLMLATQVITSSMIISLRTLLILIKLYALLILSLLSAVSTTLVYLGTK